MLKPLIDELGALQARIKRGKAVNVNDRETKDAAIALATKYFENTRPTLVEAIGNSADLDEHDGHWQDLVRLAHGNNSRKTYVSMVGTLGKELSSLSVTTLTRSVGRKSTQQGSTLTPSETQLITTLESLVPSAASSYRQGILDLQGETRLSYRGTAAEFREALRETLDHLAPDTDVMAQTSFKLEKDHTRPTMRQRVRFVMLSRERSSSQRAAAEKATSAVDELVGDLFRETYGRASVATHLETTRGEVLRIKRYVDTVLFDLLEVPD